LVEDKFQMLAHVTHILPLTTIRRERLLPVSGKVVVRKGQKVSTTDVVAEARLSPEHLQLDVARGLGLDEEQADQHIQCKSGETVTQGDVVAGPVGIGHRVVRSPQSGRVIASGGGLVLIEVESTPYELKAGLPGTVIELIDDRGVIIEAAGALVQGVWGNGRIDYGLMYALARNPNEILTAERLDVSLRGSVVMAGYCEDASVLKAAADLPLRGLILSSMSTSLVPVAAKIRFPIVVIEGFGHIPMNSLAFQLLSTNERREVAINAGPWDRISGARPEIVIPLPTASDPPLPPETDTFKEGQQVRCIRAPYIGKIGTLSALHPGMDTLPNGLLVQTAEVRLENGEDVLLPLVNLEVLE
jgi:hypothetical protein